jgi:hypothetical protein
VQPSSLIFLVLIAIWAAYLLQHWVRRREHLATARSVDRFSDAMRVLERRSPLPDLTPSAPRPRSYAISPACPSRPEVAVKRAQTLRPDAPTGSEPGVRPTPIFHILAGVSARRIRGVSLVAALSLALVVSPLAAFSRLPWWSVLVVVATLMADVIWLRHAAVTERVAGRAQAHARRSAAGTAGPEGSSQSVFFEDQSETEAEPESGFEDRAADEARPSGPIEPPAEVDPSGWAPVPVPPPTYTLKAKAPEPVAASAATELAEAENWSLDGMVYDCDLDDLVERRSASGA